MRFVSTYTGDIHHLKVAVGKWWRANCLWRHHSYIAFEIVKFCLWGELLRSCAYNSSLTVRLQSWCSSKCLFTCLYFILSTWYWLLAFPSIIKCQELLGYLFPIWLMFLFLIQNDDEWRMKSSRQRDLDHLRAKDKSSAHLEYCQL